MLTAIGYAIGPIIINRKLADLPPIGVVTASLIVAAVLYAPFVDLAVAGRRSPRRPSGRSSGSR